MHDTPRHSYTRTQYPCLVLLRTHRAYLSAAAHTYRVPVYTHTGVARPSPSPPCLLSGCLVDDIIGSKVQSSWHDCDVFAQPARLDFSRCQGRRSRLVRPSPEEGRAHPPRAEGAGQDSSTEREDGAAQHSKDRQQRGQPCDRHPGMPGMDLGRLEIPAELAVLLRTAEGLHHAKVSRITEVSLPEIKVQTNLKLPPDINNFPFSKFVAANFQAANLPELGQLLQQPLTRLPVEERQHALEIYKLILRFVGDTRLQDWQEVTLGNYIAQRVLAHPALRDEVLSQLVSLTWQNPVEGQAPRAWLLTAALLDCISPSPTLEKPLLKYVSDHGLDGYRAICQNKLLKSSQQAVAAPNVCRKHPPTLLEWTANERKGKIVLEAYTFTEEMYSTEVDSWTTGEEFASWILQSRGVLETPRGWSVSLFTGDDWQDLTGCDFVLDLIAETEEYLSPSSSSLYYPLMNDSRVGSSPSSPLIMMEQHIPPPPIMQAPVLPPPPFPAPGFNPNRAKVQNNAEYSGLDNYVDNLFNPVTTSPTELQRPGPLNSRMKGGGKIGPTHQGSYTGFPAMGQMPGYSSMPMMGGMMPGGMQAMNTMQMMPTMPAMMMPQQQPMMMPQQQPMMMPQVQPMLMQQPQPMMMQPPQQAPSAAASSRAAAEQQTFINQQALLLAQQMTLQASVLSQQQQQQQMQQQQQQLKQQEKPQKQQELPRAPEPPRAPPHGSTPPVPAPPPAPVEPTGPKPLNPQKQSRASQKKTSPMTQPTAPKPVNQLSEDERDDDNSLYNEQLDTFQQKREFFQKIGKGETEVKKVRPTSKILLPRRNSEDEEEEEEPCRESSPEPKPKVTVPPPPKPPTQKPEVQKKPKDINGSKEPKKKPTPPLKPQPSREISNIIKNYKSRPGPEPQPIQPLRKPPVNLFKRKDPKDEALAMLGMSSDKLSTGSESGDSASPPNSYRGPTAPPPPGKKGSAPSDSIREKQLPLMNVFSAMPRSHPPGAPPTPPVSRESTKAPPIPPPFMPPAPDTQAPVLKDNKIQGSARSLLEDTNIKSLLCKLSASVYFSYANVDWKIFLRKEVFYPREKFTQPYCLNLLCEQIMRDTYSESCFRISKEERRKMKDLLAEFRVGTDAKSILEEGIKKRIVVAARDNWANYFSRLFTVTGENGSDVQLLGVSHRGIRLLKIVKAAGFNPEHLKILCSYSYADVLSVELRTPNTLEFSLRNEQLVLLSSKACQLKALVDLFLHELKKDSIHVIALRSYITDDKSLLHFKKGDIIKLLPIEGLQPGWQFGSIGGRSGLFPSNIVQSAAAPDYFSLQMNNRKEEYRKSMLEPPVQTNGQSPVRTSTESPLLKTLRNESPVPSMTSDAMSVDGNQYTMVEFAMKYFREVRTMMGWKGMSAEGKRPLTLVQHTKVPIQESLILYDDKELNELATNNFMNLMKFMGDQPHHRTPDENVCVYEILQLCREKETLRDEVYCQVIKQLTENPKKESCTRGWRLLSILSGYFLPTATLLPYVTKYLQEVCSQADSSYQDIARTCQDHLRQTMLYRGRRHFPFNVEMEALLKGRASRRLEIALPGELQFTTKVKTFTVAAHIGKDLCGQLGIDEPLEIREFAIFANKSQGQVVRPIRGEEYIHDFLLEDNSVSLEFRRITWKTSLHFENDIYTTVHYNQVLWEYLNRKLFMMDRTVPLEKQTGILAALQHLVKGLADPPSKQELMDYIPRCLIQQVNLQSTQKYVLQEIATIMDLSPWQAKVRFIETVTQLPLFDSNIYEVKRMSEPGVPAPCYMAVNREHIMVVDKTSQNTYLSIPLTDIQTMKTLRPMDSATLPGVEVNYGTTNKPKSVWFELHEAKEVYHTIAIIMEDLDSSSLP
ncbi:myosin XVB isoform X2 [Lissotriton helveticus]